MPKQNSLVGTRVTFTETFTGTIVEDYGDGTVLFEDDQSDGERLVIPVELTTQQQKRGRLCHAISFLKNIWAR